MITVYFEHGGYAEMVATFETEEAFIRVSPMLEQLAAEQGFERLTESVE